MALLINHAILHIINNAGTGTCFSKQELDVDSETCSEFIQKHVRRLLTNPAAREACFTAQSAVYRLVRAYQKDELRFKEFSLQMCERLSGIMQANKEIPPADVLVADFENRNKRYLALLKLNYGECFTHRVVEDDAGLENQIVKNTAVLPASGTRVEEACLIPYDPMVLRVLEKPYSIDGEEQFYFSRLFLECDAEMSKKETADLIAQIAEEINAKHFDGNLEMAARLKCALMDEAEEPREEEALCLENVAKRVFHREEHAEAKAEFLELAKEIGLPYEVKLDKSFVQRQFKTQHFRADNGIELKFPSELFQDPEVIRFDDHPDGTVTITLKHLRSC